MGLGKQTELLWRSTFIWLITILKENQGVVTIERKFRKNPIQMYWNSRIWRILTTTSTASKKYRGDSGWNIFGFNIMFRSPLDIPLTKLYWKQARNCFCLGAICRAYVKQGEDPFGDQAKTLKIEFGLNRWVIPTSLNSKISFTFWIRKKMAAL